MHGSFVILIVLQAVPCIVIVCIVVDPGLGQQGRAWDFSIGTPIGNIVLVWVAILMFRRYNASPHIQVAAEIVLWRLWLHFGLSCELTLASLPAGPSHMWLQSTLSQLS